MIKRTLYFGNPAYLSLRQGQLLVRLPEAEAAIALAQDQLDERFTAAYQKEAVASIPIEDIGLVVLDHAQVVLSQALLATLLEYNVAVITCNAQHMPQGLFFPLAAHTVQTERFKHQLEASAPLMKNLWQQTVSAKIMNQAALLVQYNIPARNMQEWARQVKSGDSENHESRASAYYWSKLFTPDIPNFRRHREGEPPNQLLNYGYAILRAIIARALAGSGLLPTRGIFHRNKYNAFCLADDIMEPYRPWVDALVKNMVVQQEDYQKITKFQKQVLLNIPTLDVLIDGERSPLMVAAQRTTASLARCFAGEQRKIVYPEWPDKKKP
ncbi:MAG: type II CRISPR-associated endonuclease Cas1 [Flavobacteriales bacterium]|nr:type II CRISPR-associated endonuclease Cas1 [Flavobacteriales bacterium]